MGVVASVQRSHSSSGSGASDGAAAASSSSLRYPTEAASPHDSLAGQTTVATGSHASVSVGGRSGWSGRYDEQQQQQRDPDHRRRSSGGSHASTTRPASDDGGATRWVGVGVSVRDD